MHPPSGRLGHDVARAAAQAKDLFERSYWLTITATWTYMVSVVHAEAKTFTDRWNLRGGAARLSSDGVHE